MNMNIVWFVAYILGCLVLATTFSGGAVWAAFIVWSLLYVIAQSEVRR